MTDLSARLKGVFVLAPLFIAAYLGNPLLAIALAIVVILMSYELSSILAPQTMNSLGLTILFLLGAGAGCLAEFMPSFAPIGIGMMAFILFSVVSFKAGMLQACFAVTVMLCMSSVSYLLFFDKIQPLIISLALIVAASDMGAYFIGRFIGGAKLAPTISPGKTISGAVGGLVSALIIAWLLSDYVSFLNLPVILIGLFCGLFSQAGDLFESAFKRKMNIKDSSQLIPGHGGVLDRFDGYLFLLPLVAIWLGRGGM